MVFGMFHSVNQIGQLDDVSGIATVQYRTSAQRPWNPSNHRVRGVGFGSRDVGEW